MYYNNLTQVGPLKLEFINKSLRKWWKTQVNKDHHEERRTNEILR